jgi:hypothetical protein
MHRVRRLQTTVLVALMAAGAPAGAQRAVEDGGGLIQDVQRLGAGDGWVRTGAAVLSTRTGGATWQDVTPGRGMEGVTGMYFLDAARGWLVGVNPGAPGQLFVQDTEDGGRTWSERPVPGSELEADDVYARATVHFRDARHGWLLGKVATSAAFSEGRLLRTEDGGRTWRRLPRPPTAGPLVFVTGERGFLVDGAEARTLYLTEDGGERWREVSLVPGLVLHGLPSFRSPDEGSVAVTVSGEAPRLLTFVTRDGGRTWRQDASLELPAGADAAPALAAFSERGQLQAVAAGGRVRASGSAGAVDLLDGKGSASIQSLALAGDDGWALVAEGACDAWRCQRSTRLVALDAGSRRASPRLLLERSVSEARGFEGSGLASTTSFDKGFDQCAAGTTGQMQAWRSSSPYRDANIYFGGSARACPQANLTSSWVSTVFSQGWRLIPTWVGPQAPCTQYGSRFSYDIATARSQGLSEASAAVSAAQALGLGAGTPLYYDLENYNETQASCAAASSAFINAWVERIRASGYVAGVYANAYDAQHDMTPGVIAHVPDAVWIAQWACGAGTTSCGWSPTVWGISGLSDGYWVNNQRIRQYWGDHNETWGGVTFKIDSNYANGPVATSGGGSTGGSFTCDDGDACFSLFGPSQYWHRETACGGASIGTGGDLYWTYTDTTLANSARWTPSFGATGGAGSYTVAVFIPRCYATSQQARYRIYHNGVSDYATVNQNNVYDGWVTLGTYYFRHDGSEYVELVDATGEALSLKRQIAFDAVRFTR